MEKSDLLKFQMFNQISRLHRDLTIKDLSSILHVEYQAAYNVFQELLEELRKLTDAPRVTVRKALRGKAPLPISVDEYRSYLFKRAIGYTLIDYAVSAPRPNITHFCAVNFISASTVSRRAKRIEDFLDHYHVKLRLRPLSLQGDEMHIRLMLQAMYWQAHHGTFWPFEAVIPEKLVQMYGLKKRDPNPIARLKDCLFIGICSVRVGLRNRLDESAYLELITDILEKAQLPWSGNTNAVSLTEAAFVESYRAAQISFAPEMTTTDAAMTVDLAVLTNPVTQCVSRVIQVAIQQWYPQINRQQLHNLLRLASGVAIFGDCLPYDHLLKLAKPIHPDVAAAIAAALLTLPEGGIYAAFRKHCQELSVLVIAVLGEAAMVDQGKHNIKIELQVAPDEFGYRQLKAFLSALPWIEISPNQPDLRIISERYRPVRHAETGPKEFQWFEDALSTKTYRGKLLEILTTLRD